MRRRISKSAFHNAKANDPDLTSVIEVAAGACRRRHNKMRHLLSTIFQTPCNRGLKIFLCTGKSAEFNTAVMINATCL